MVDESKLEFILLEAWNNETSSTKNWSKENPALGQCAVTALIVNDYLGGEIVWANVNIPDGINTPKGREVYHYFNKINDVEIDLTRIQFPKGTVIPKGVPKTKEFSTTRDYILSFEATQKRYEILKERVKFFLSD